MASYLYSMKASPLNLYFTHTRYSQYKQLMLAVSLKQDFALTTDDGKKRKQGIFKKELKTLSKSS